MLTVKGFKIYKKFSVFLGAVLWGFLDTPAKQKKLFIKNSIKIRPARRINFIMYSANTKYRLVTHALWEAMKKKIFQNEQFQTIFACGAYRHRSSNHINILIKIWQQRIRNLKGNIAVVKIKGCNILKCVKKSCVASIGRMANGQAADKYFVQILVNRNKNLPKCLSFRQKYRTFRAHLRRTKLTKQIIWYLPTDVNDL